MLQKKSIGVSNESNEIKEELSSKYPYNEKLENGRIILDGRRVKFVQIMNTEEDRNKYQTIMQKYVDYVRDYYTSEASSDGCNMNKCFHEEISVENGKLPMFFIYNKRGELLGMAGIRSIINAKAGDKKIKMQELSVRIVGEAKESSFYGYGALVYLILHLYVLNKNIDVFAKTYFQKRDFWFHIFDKVSMHYIETKMSPFSFLSKQVKMDIFASMKNIELI